MNTLFDKYMNDELNEREAKQLIEILKSDSNGQMLVEYIVETQAILTLNENINSLKIVKTNKSPMKYFIWPAVAALLAITFLFLSTHEELKVVSAPKAFLISNVSQELLHNDQSIYPGNTVEAIERTELIFNDKSRIILSRGSRLTLKSLIPNKELFLEKGTATFITSTHKDGSFTCSTEDLISTALGTEFSVSKFKNSTLVRVTESEVLVKNLNKELILKEGSEAIGNSKKITTSDEENFTYLRWLNWSKTFRDKPGIACYMPFHKEVITNLSKEFIGYESSGKKVDGRWPEKNAFTGKVTFPKSSLFNPGKELSLFAWIKLQKRNDHPPIITKGDDSWRLQLDGDALYLDLSDGPMKTDNPVRGKTKINTNTWYHVTAVFTETQIKLYLNGQLEGVSDSTNRNFLNDAKVVIGGNEHQPQRKFHGLIDEAAIIKKALSQEEIISIFKNSKP